MDLSYSIHRFTYLTPPMHPALSLSLSVTDGLSCKNSRRDFPTPSSYAGRWLQDGKVTAHVKPNTHRRRRRNSTVVASASAVCIGLYAHRSRRVSRARLLPEPACAASSASTEAQHEASHKSRLFYA